MKRTLLLFLSLWLLAVCHAQQTPGPRLSFEVASIRPGDPAAAQGFAIKPMAGGNGYTVRNASVKAIMSLMLKMPQRQITGGQDWLNSAGFDIEARADHERTLDDRHAMMMNLLADRFHLQFHNESREGNIYALLLEKTGTRMKPNLTPPDFNVVLTYTGPGTATGVRVSMPYLCWALGQNLPRDDRPVIDQTGLTGFFDFKLAWLPEFPSDIPRDSLPAELLDRPSIFEAVREQLGLRLQAQKGPVPVLVVDHVEKLSDN